MKTIALFVVMVFGVTAHSQSLLDAVYSGKLKADTGTVLRKGDTLKIKENMAQKVVADSLRKDSIAAAAVAAAAAADSALAVKKQDAVDAKRDSLGNISAADSSAIVTSVVNDIAVAETAAAKAEEKNIPKDNNRIWKTFMDTVSSVVRAEVIPSGKIKKGTYSVLINYEIRPDGQVAINTVAADPASSFLEEQLKLRLTLDAPKMNPVMGTNGQARTVARKQMLTFTK